MVFRHLFEKYLDPPDAYDCSYWAFGNEFEFAKAPTLIIRWNDLHGNLFRIDSYETISDNIPKIIDAWIAANAK